MVRCGRSATKASHWTACSASTTPHGPSNAPLVAVAARHVRRGVGRLHHAAVAQAEDVLLADVSSFVADTSSSQLPLR